jgi:twitching motility protein PilT
MVSTSSIREYIKDAEKTPLIRQAIQDGVVQYGMQTFDQALMKLVQDGRVGRDEALRASSNPHELALRMGGIQASSDQTWSRFERKDSQAPAKAPF